MFGIGRRSGHNECLPFPRGDKSSLELGEKLADAAAKRHGAAAGHAGDKVRVGVGKVAAAVVADHVQTRNRISFGVDGIHVRVDLNAVHRAQNVAGVLSAVDGRLVKRRQTEGFLAVIDVVAVLAELVVALDSLDKLFGRLTEPVAVVGRFGLGDDFNGNFTFGLCDALGGRLVNGLRKVMLAPETASMSAD